MKRLKLNLDQLGKELEMLDNEHLRAIKGGWDGGYGAYGGYNSWEDLWEAMQNGYVPPEGDYNPGGYGGYWGDFGGYGGYNNPIPIPGVNIYGGDYNGYDDYWEDYYGGYYGNYGGYYTGGYGGYYNGGYGGYYDGGYGGYYGGGGGGGGSYTPPTNNIGNNDPWERDEDGNIITQLVEGKTYSQDFEGYHIVFQEVIIEGTDIRAYKVIEVYDSNDTQLLTIPDDFKSNCHGYAFADGQLWFNEPYDPNLRDPDYNEMEGLENMLRSNSLYTAGVTQSEADVAVIWTDSGNGWMWH